MVGWAFGRPFWLYSHTPEAISLGYWGTAGGREVVKNRWHKHFSGITQLCLALSEVEERTRSHETQQSRQNAKHPNRGKPAVGAHPWPGMGEPRCLGDFIGVLVTRQLCQLHGRNPEETRLPTANARGATCSFALHGFFIQLLGSLLCEHHWQKPPMK